MNIGRYIVTIGFLVLITFPVINNCLSILPQIAGSENRRLGTFPKIDSCPIEKYPKALEDYIIDHTSIRNQFIRLYNKLNIFVFRSSPVNIEAFIGKDGWYYFSGEELKTYCGTGLFTDKELTDLKNEMLRRKDIIEKNYNAKVYIAIVPNKANIYPEHMPDQYVKSKNWGYGQQMVNYLENNNFLVIDLYQPLTEAKKTCAVYYKTDNHWNDFGAFTATNTILSEFKKAYPNIKLLSLNTYKIKAVKEKAGRIAKMLSIDDELPDSNYIPTREGGFISYEKDSNKYKPTEDFPYPWDYQHTRYTNNDSLPTVLIIRDSFGEKLFPYISERCKKCTVIFDNWHYGLNEEIIKGEKPNIVLYLILESQLKNLMKSTPGKGA